MSKNQLPTQLPESLYRFFWDIDATKLNPAEKPYYVINRLINMGNIESVRWMLKYFPRSLILDTFKKMRDFNEKTGTFWAHYLQVNPEEFICMQEPYRSQRKQLWPY